MQLASRIAKATDYTNTSDNEVASASLVVAKQKENPTLNTEKLIIHYTHERRFATFKKDIHSLWNEIFQYTPVLHTKLIIGHRNQKNATKELIRRRPHQMPKLLLAQNHLQPTRKFDVTV